MAKRPEGGRTYTVSVVGLSGTEREKGPVGVGKSCLCNRFMRPLADDYHTDHISVLSQSDFGGRVVNNDHFLYWGEVTKIEDGLDFTFHLVEQTEFVDDASFQQFKSGKTEPYVKRCAASKIQSAEKLMYICKNQLALEHEFEQKLLPDGKLNVDGFLCLFDASEVPNRTLERQVEVISHIIGNLMKTKKPIVLVVTKMDEVNENYVREVERLAQRKELKVPIPIVETSAHDGVNVESAFLTLAHLIDSAKLKNPRLRLVPFAEAAHSRKELLKVAEEAYQHLLRSHILDYKILWSTWSKKFSTNSDFNHYVELFGTDSARKLFNKRVRQLQAEHIRQKERIYLEQLPLVLEKMLPDLATISSRNWLECQETLRTHASYDEHLVDASHVQWRDSDHLDSLDVRIPFDLLDEEEAEAVFTRHVKALHDEQRRLDLRRKFRQLLDSLLQGHHAIIPGKQLAEVSIQLMGRESYDQLSEKDRYEVYEQFQSELKERAKNEFEELLWERADLFNRFEGQFDKDDITDIQDRLSKEPRYQALNKMNEDRRAMLVSHLAFIHSPSSTPCPFKENCMESVIERALASRGHSEGIPPQSWSRNSQWLINPDDNRLNLVILGSEGLADELASEIRAQCIDDEYTHEETIYSLDYRTIDGDVNLPQYSFKTPEFSPHGCLCVFSNADSLDYLRTALDKTLLSEMRPEERKSFQGLPVVVVLAYDPDSEKMASTLRDEGQTLADRLQCPFITFPPAPRIIEKHFHDNQVSQAVRLLFDSIKHRAGFIDPFRLAENLEPDVRIVMCFTCGDRIHLPVGPLLSHQCCYVTSDKYQALSLETYLGDSKRRVEIVLTSIHGAGPLRDEFNHGYILVYSAKRKASLTNLRVFASGIQQAPTLILAVTESGGANAFFSNEYTQALITEGNAIADRLRARFMTTSANFQQQTAVFTPFFKMCWDRRSETENSFKSSFSGDELRPDIDKRPPAALPKNIYIGKVSTSNSQSVEDSEPVYDVPIYDRCHSDSDGQDRGSSSSPPAYEHDIYSEIPAHADMGDDIIKTTQLRRNMYAEMYRKKYPDGKSSFTTSSTISRDSKDSEGDKERESSGMSADSESIQPRYQFRKSKSMKLALQQDDDEGVPANTVIDASGKRLQKASTLPATGRVGQEEGWIDNDIYDSANQDDRGDRVNPLYEPLDAPLLPPMTKPKPPLKPKPQYTYLSKFQGMTEVIKRKNFGNTKNYKQRQQEASSVQAPLAVMDPIEIAEDYATVRDSIPPEDNDYASVQDALPAGKVVRILSIRKPPEYKTEYGPRAEDNLPLIGHAGGTDSESEFSSLERQQKDIYFRVNRKPTPHKKRHKHSRPSDSFHGDLPMVPPTLETYDKVRSNSPSEGSEGTEGDDHPKKPVRRRSLKDKRKKKISGEFSGLTISPPLSDNDLLIPASKMRIEDDDDSSLYEPIRFPMHLQNDQTSPGPADDVGDMADSGNWRKLLKFRSDKDSVEKQKRKEEKKAQADEKRRNKEIREEERKQQKAQDKLQKKMKKKDSRAGPLPQSGTSLEEFAQSEGSNIPLFIEKCIQYIEDEGVTTEGIYRVPGNKAQVDFLIERFKEDPNVNIASLDIPVNAVATALKGFFMELSDPLIPTNIYDELIEAVVPSRRPVTQRNQGGAPEKSSRLLMLRGVLKKLPSVNYDVLKYLVTHLRKVSDFQGENNMDTKNLAICWWPTILRPEFTSFEMMTQSSKYLEEMVLALLDQFGFFFFGRDEEV
ncbi:rho GTPase-activating protein 190-like isoform X4 [Lineus longissimus]|uniref:rho GTPase-activating protein 190-like isoform X4 n=1 Tax=Lineus longissimus TaxID=88925 RepID=UPI00315C9C43